MNRILVPGETCWRIEPADNLACIVDATQAIAAAQYGIARQEQCSFFAGTRADVGGRLARHLGLEFGQADLAVMIAVHPAAGAVLAPPTAT